MTTTSDFEYALLAGDAYFSTRAETNRFPVPNGWTEDTNKRRADDQTGFEARTFQKGTEIVISFAGTYDKSFADINADANLIAGVYNEQLLQAAKYYLDIKKQYPGATITLTGHSLGGGLAALVGVFFNQTTVAFDEIPCANAARAFADRDVASQLLSALSALKDGNDNPLYDVSALSQYITLRGSEGGIPRSGNVTNIRVDGELATSRLVDCIGTPRPLLHGETDASQTSLHSQALLATFLLSQQNPSNGKTLQDVTYKLTDLLRLLADNNLYANETDPNTNRQNFLDRLVQNEVGVAGPNSGNAMVKRFTSDLWKIAQDGGLTTLPFSSSSLLPGSSHMAQTLIAFAMQFYYEGSSNAVNPDKTLFSDVTGGIRLDLADVSKDIAAAMAASERVDLSTAKGFEQYFRAYLQQGSFTDAERQLILSVLPYMHDWYVQAGSNGLATTDDLNRGAFMLGGVGSDALAGGDKSDLLVGNAGDDVLMGGKGNDTLLGGSGFDTYVVQAGRRCRRPLRNTPKYIANYSMNMQGYCQFGLQLARNLASRQGTHHKAHRTTHQGAHHA